MKFKWFFLEVTRFKYLFRSPDLSLPPAHHEEVEVGF